MLFGVLPLAALVGVILVRKSRDGVAAGYATGADALSLVEQMRTKVSAGIAATKQRQFGEAVKNFKDAGWLGVLQVGPALDQQTGGQSKEFTHRAWEINAQLQAVGKVTSPYMPMRTDDPVAANQAWGNANVMLRNYDAAAAAAAGRPDVALSQ